MKNTFLMLVSVLLIGSSCGSDGSKSTAKTENIDSAATANTTKPVNAFDSAVPDACTLITDAEIASIVGVEIADIIIKDGSNGSDPKARSCFFKWSDATGGNLGILIQVQKNPIPEEYAEWPTLFIDSKIQNGEQTFDGTDITHKFEKWDIVGDSGCYSYEAAKYHWRVANDLLFMIAFNTDDAKKAQMMHAERIAKIVMSNFSKS